MPVKWIDEVLDLALERPLPGRAPVEDAAQPPLPKPEARARNDVKH